MLTKIVLRNEIKYRLKSLSQLEKNTASKIIERRVLKFLASVMSDDAFEKTSAPFGVEVVKTSAENQLRFENADSRKKVFIFLSHQFEPNTRGVIEELLKWNWEVSVPVIKDNFLFEYTIDSETKFALNKYNIFEPLLKKKELDCLDNRDAVENFYADIVIVPLLGFDENLARLGRGKGFYDRYFENKNQLKVGIAFHCQQLEYVPLDQFDVALDLIITDSGIIDNQGNI